MTKSLRSAGMGHGCGHWKEARKGIEVILLSSGNPIRPSQNIFMHRKVKVRPGPFLTAEAKKRPVATP
jgi:hypothetical protein